MLPRIHLCRNKIRLRSIGSTSISWWSSGLPRHYSINKPEPTFETNIDKLKADSAHNAKDKQNVNSGLSGMLVRFIQKESQILRELMNLEDTLDPDADMDNLDIPAPLRQILESQIDDYGRFLVLLTFHPLSIPPGLMMHYYLVHPSVSSQERADLLRFLVFHNRWYDFWLVGVSDSTTMSDVEELIDLAHECLTSNGNLDLGIWQALAAAHLVTSNLGLLNTICENFEFRLDLSKGSVEEFFSFLFSIQGATDTAHLKQLTATTDLASNRHFRSFYLRKLAGLIGPNDQAILSFMHDVQSDTEITTTPGFASFLLSAEEIPKTLYDRLANAFVSSRKTHLNDHDYFCILQSSQCQLHATYLSLCKNIKRKLVRSDYIVNAMIGQCVSSNLALAEIMVQKFSLSISADTWALLLPHLLDNDAQIPCLKKLRKTQPAKFQKVVEAYLSNNQELSDGDLLKVIDISDDHPFLIRKLLRRLSSDSDNLPRLLDFSLSAYNLLEVLRFAVRHRIVDHHTLLLVDRIFHQTWDLERLSRQASIVHSEQNVTSDLLSDDFRVYYGASTEKDKQALLFNIQALAQTISLAPPETAANFLNKLHQFLFSESFTFVKSDTGRSYIFDRLVRKTMHFIYRNNSLVPKKGVLVIRDVLSKLDFDSTVTQAALFELIVYDDPGISIDILRNYRKSKAFLTTPLMEGIQIGILRSSKLSPAERLDLFEKFRATMRELSYRSKMTAKTMARFGDLIFKVGKERGDTQGLGWVVKLGYERGVPVKVIKNWSLKIRNNNLA